MTELPWTPSADIEETDDELVVTMEVPGLDRDDLDLRITPQGLVVRGEKREETESKRRGYQFVERRYGSFARTVPLPPGLDVDRVDARVKRGVLTVKIPKAAAASGLRRIPIKT
jgi:HSP20 family protein